MSISKASAGLAKRFCVSISTWFIVPEQGMKDLDILNRGSAFIVPARSKDFQHRYHVITASHIVAPWRWNKLYTDEFLSFITEKNTHNTIDLRNPDGSSLTSCNLIPRSFHHPRRDLAVMHLDNELEDIKFLQEHGVLMLDFCPRPDVGEPLQFNGHAVRAPNPFDDPSKAGQDVRMPMPATVKGALAGWSRNQTFCTTETILTDGMCGGPVTLLASSKVCGMIEGIVKADNDIEDLRGMTVYIEENIISEFIDMIEADKVDEDDVLLGGEAAWHVHQDQDPEKLGIENLAKRA